MDGAEGSASSSGFALPVGSLVVSPTSEDFGTCFSGGQLRLFWVFRGRLWTRIGS
jgi:hypothetical protein